MNMDSKIGVLLINLGTPKSPKTSDVRSYLKEFLMDGRVIDIPHFSRWLLVQLIIAPFRGPKSAKLYKELWQIYKGSPLLQFGHNNKEQLQAKMGQKYEVKLAMRYQEPSISRALEEFRKEGILQWRIIPLFPQYASATTGSVIEKVNELIRDWEIMPDIKWQLSFWNHTGFIKAFVANIKTYLDKNQYDKILMSYHGLPARQIEKASHRFGQNCALGACCETLTSKNQHCYRAQCFQTSKRLAEELGLNPDQYLTCFQSRLGKSTWLQPYTEDTVRKLTKEGHKKMLVISPAFIADCLETTLELGEELKEIFEEEGGEHWDWVESLNDSEEWIEALESMAVELG